MRRLRVAVAIGALLALAAGCGGSTKVEAVALSVGYWTKQHLTGAVPDGATVPHMKTSRPATNAPKVGALFYRDTTGGHYCTASVIDSPHHDMIVTAAHCVHGGKGSGYRQDVVFVPEYRDGAAPDGVWQMRSAAIVDPRWISSSDPDLDVAFAVLQPLNGREIGDVLGANKLGVDQGYDHRVRVTGYPSDQDAPITCLNRITAQSATQMRFSCTGYEDGTSGSPWVTDFDTRTRTGVVIGVIGGYQLGGNTPDVSYSPYFDDDVLDLYRRAVAVS